MCTGICPNIRENDQGKLLCEVSILDRVDDPVGHPLTHNQPIGQTLLYQWYNDVSRLDDEDASELSQVNMLQRTQQYRCEVSYRTGRWAVDESVIVASNIWKMCK